MRLLFVLLLAVTAGWPSDQPLQVDPDVAGRNLLKKTDPIPSPMAKSMRLGGTVVLEATISPEGKIAALKAISGHPILFTAALDAVRRWEYKPFLLNGQPVTVITRITVSFPSPTRTKSEEKAQRDYYPEFQRCYDMVHAYKNVEAEVVCSNAVHLADQLPPERVLERSSARTFLAHSLLGQQKIAESIPIYEKALEIRSTYEGAERDADFAWTNANLARAYFRAGQREKADPLYARAVKVFEAAIRALPDMKDKYTPGLKNTLQEYAKLKDAESQPEQARELQKKAAALPGR